MKVLIVALVVLAGLCFVEAEIVPRFPGVQPIRVFDDSTTDTPDEVQIEDKLVIDSYEFDTFPPVVVQLPSSGAPPSVSKSAFDRSDTILGGERDIILTAEQGTGALVFSAGASGGAFSVATPNHGSGFCVVQYDGIDSSESLSTNPGLRGVDLTQGEAIGFRILALTDIDTQFSITLVDQFGRTSSATAEVPGGAVTISFFFDFELFTTNIDLTNIFAIEFEIEAFDNVDFTMEVFSTYGLTEAPGDCFSGSVLPCDFDYYRIETFDNVQVGDYFVITYTADIAPEYPETAGNFYVLASDFEDLQTELATNQHIEDTLGALPGEKYYDYKCTTDCTIEIVWSALGNTTYYFGVEGRGNGILDYTICLAYRNVPVFQLLDRQPQPIFFDQRPDVPPDDRVRHYRYYVIDVPEQRFSPGTYLQVNISRAEPIPGLTIRLMYESLPETAQDTGILGSVDFNSHGQRVDNMIYPYCVDMDRTDKVYYEHPVKTDPRIPCECTTDILLFGAGPSFQLTCNITVDPCHFRYGNYYVSVELPERDFPTQSQDTSGQTNYTIAAYVVQPIVNELQRNVTYHSYVNPEAAAHFFIDIPAFTTVSGESHLLVHVSNVRGGFVNIYVHQGLGEPRNLAGGREGCVPANATCQTCDACNVVIEKCHFVPGTWYISLEVPYDENAEAFKVTDWDRLPIGFSIRANWMEDPIPEPLIAGVAVNRYIGEALYDFYVLNVPPTVDTWLVVELYAAACDTEVILSILHGELPGGECYSRPDFYCVTGDPKEKVWTTGPPTFYENEPVQRESCSFMIQTCELAPGPLFFSVYGHHTGYAAYGDTTFYQVPVHYTLWVDFDSALALTSAVSYSETVFEDQYQHYYIRADRIYEGSWLSVEVTNIKHGIPQSIEAFVNYNYLAGQCPCYENLYNCTGASACSRPEPALPIPTFLQDGSSVVTCCTIIVPASDFRPGVWYVSVLGVNEDYYQYTTPVGYTLTVTIHNPPEFVPLLLGQTYSGVVPQWNQTYEYSFFRLGASPIPLNDLVFKLTFVQNCEFLGKHDDTNDALWMYVNHAAPANGLGFDYHCKADVFGESFCTIVVPHCEWDGDNYFVAVQGDYNAVFEGRFTLQAFTQEVREIVLTDGVSRYDRVGTGLYKHFYIDTTAPESQYLFIDLYTNSDQDWVSMYVNKDEKAGATPCYRNIHACTTKSTCTYQIKACDMEPGRYYISVYGEGHHFYDTSVEFTLTATHKTVSTSLFAGNPVTGNLWNPGDVQHYEYLVQDARQGAVLTFTVDNVKHGTIQAYAQFGFLAGRCPCYVYTYTCSAGSGASGTGTDTLSEWCEITVPVCELREGTYYLSVFAVENLTPDPPVFQTPIGYVVEVDLTSSLILTPFVDVGRDLSKTSIFQFVGDKRYVNYQFEFTQDDFALGYHIIVEITEVRDGSLFVYYNTGFPGDSYHQCHITEICTNGLTSGGACSWQLPYCLTKPDEEEPERKHYITIEGVTGRSEASYNILIYKQDVPTVLPDNAFSLDTVLNSQAFALGTELNITHSKVNQPNGWTQFIRLIDVPHADTERGELLEIFFYRVTNNPGQNLDFNVYVHPNEPAGPHGCCQDHATLGYCQEAPCSNTADTTTSINNGFDVFSHTCSFGVTGVGSDGNGNPFFGQRCTVKVWPCEFEKYCNGTTDWFVTVVPLAPTNPTTNGAGLSYSVQWRVRNIREPSIDLTSSINLYNFTSTFTLGNNSTETEGWASYFIDWPSEPNSRLSIQTLFTLGSGVVYINGDEFASYTDTCNDYTCSSGSDCDGAERFIVSECCTERHERYYISVQNTGAVNSNVEYSFRIVSVTLPATQVINGTLSEDDVYVTSSAASIFSGVTGVDNENYDFYQLTIDDNDLFPHRTWVVIAERPDINDAGFLNLYIRYGVEPGSYGPSQAQAYYGNADEGCHTYQYTCTFSFGTRCLFEIPRCALLKGHYFLSLHNPAFRGDGIPTDLPDYNLYTFFSNPPIPLELLVPYTAEVNTDLGILQHYTVTIIPEDIGFDVAGVNGYWSRYLRITVLDVDNSVSLYLNYDDLAGTGDYACAPALVEAHCGTGACILDVTPCESDGNAIKLKTGTYFIAVVADTVDYVIEAEVFTNDYRVLEVTQVIAGTGHRSGTTNTWWNWVSTEDELIANGDGFGHYRYYIDSGEALLDNEYIVVNISTFSDANAGEGVHFELWRDDCTRWHCATDGSRSWCTIDALELGAPCSGNHNGRFWIRVDNPAGVVFSIDFYRNETTVQTLNGDQRITEIIYPYEYQEYYYEASEVEQGATLLVQVCAICGEVQAFIRPDLPAGPAHPVDGAADSCAIDTCIASGSDQSEFSEGGNCCSLFLDTCVYEQRGYYIGIRGVTTVYPDQTNEHLYLPAKYEINAEQTLVNVTEISFSSCPETISYYDEKVPQQYAFDLETLQLGTEIKISLRVPDHYESPFASVWFNPNQTVGYSSACQDNTLNCNTLFDNSCTIIVPYCSLLSHSGGRYYLWVDAPRGSEIIIERWEPTIPIIYTDLVYHGTIDVNFAYDWDLPWTTGKQYYRFDLDPHDDANYYEKFYVRISVENIRFGSVELVVNSGWYPDPSGCSLPVYLNSISCAGPEECYVEIQYNTLLNAVGGNVDNIPTRFWVTIIGEEQECELHSVQYSFVVKTQWVLTYLPLSETICGTVATGDYNFHRLRPKSIEDPQATFLRFQFTDLNPGVESLSLAVRDSYIATKDGSVVVSSDGDNILTGYYICGYQDLYVSVFGDYADDGLVDYRLTVDKIRAHVKFVYDDSIYYADDDDDDACPHDHDFYLFRTADPLGHHAGSFFRVAVDSLFPTKVFINKESFAWNGCHDSGYGENDPAETGTTTVNIYDFCDFADGRYFITVVSDGPYYIYTDIRDDAIPLTLGQVYRDTLQIAEYQVYTLEICADWFDYDDRLVVEITDVDNGDVFGWIRFGGVPGRRTSTSGSESCAEDSAFADYSPANSGYDFLLVNHGELQAGTYYILIRTSPHEGSPERNCERVSYRLFPYLVDYDIPEDSIREIIPNVPLTDAVDYYWINRIDPTVTQFVNYYILHPLMEGEGFFEQISHAVIQLSNVQGGLLTVRVSRDSLAVAPEGFIPGPITALTKTGLIDPETHIQWGRRPYTYQTIFDTSISPYQADCDGNADYCCSTSFDEVSQYRRDKSCAIWLPSCYYIWSEFYIAVEADTQFYQNQEVTYELAVHNTRDFILLQPNTHHVGSFLDDNWNYDFYYSISPYAQSMRWRVVVSEGEGVLVTVRNHRCPHQADWVKEVWCDADYFDRPWLCDIEIVTEAAHPGDNSYFISVNGKNATYSIAFYRGRENCHDFSGAGRNEGLDFCAGLVPYATWRWDNYVNLDNEAQCLFEQLYDHFRVQPCWSGVSRECNATLQSFACYESFHACDEYGFAVGTCRDACDAVVYECVNWFESVDLEHYNCTSHRYLDQSYQTCTGNSDFISFDELSQEFLENDPNLILFKSSPSASSGSTLVYSVLVTILALALLL